VWVRGDDARARAAASACAEKPAGTGLMSWTASRAAQCAALASRKAAAGRATKALTTTNRKEGMQRHRASVATGDVAFAYGLQRQ